GGPDNRQFALMFNWLHVDIDRWRDFLALRGREYQEPAIPAFAAQDRSSFILLPGAEPPAEDLAPLQAIHDFCRDPAILEKLRVSWEGRERARKAAELARLADPPEK